MNPIPHFVPTVLHRYAALCYKVNIAHILTHVYQTERENERGEEGESERARHKHTQRARESRRERDAKRERERAR